MDFVMKLVDRLVVMNFGSKLVEGVPAAVRAEPGCRQPTWERGEMSGVRQ